MTMGRVQIRVWERLDKFLEQYHIIYHTTSYHTIIRSYHNKFIIYGRKYLFLLQTSAGYLLFYTSFDFQPPKYLIKS